MLDTWEGGWVVGAGIVDLDPGHLGGRLHLGGRVG